MPTDRDFKRLVRARMQKTGEAYTAARAQLLRTPRAAPAPAPAPAVAAMPVPAVVLHTSPVPSSARAPAPGEYARLAGMSDAALEAKTGCTWEKWVFVLDKAGAQGWPHREIAAYCREKYQAGPWWGQMIAVGYERIRGLRVKGQQRSGEFRVSKSRTVALPLPRLYRAFSYAPTRRRWLGVALPKARSATPGKYLRWLWPDGSVVVVTFVRRGRGKTQVNVEQAPLPDREAVERCKAFWGAALDRLGVLT